MRTRNQDAAGFNGWGVLDGTVATRRLSLIDPLCCVVADGAGGHPAGERASAAAVAGLMAAAPLTDGTAVVEAIGAVHRRLHDEMALDPACHGMATTLAVLVATPDDILLANVGDSRIYEVAGDGLLQMSVDDRPERPEWAEADYQSSVLTQVVGGYDAAVTPVPHVDRCHPEDGLRFLLCSDGLGACMPDDRVAELLHAAPNDLTAARTLVDAALRAGAPDNVTVMLVRIERPEDS